MTYFSSPEHQTFIDDLTAGPRGSTHDFGWTKAPSIPMIILSVDSVTTIGII